MTLMLSVQLQFSMCMLTLTLQATVSPAPPPLHRAPKLERPKIGLNASTEDWNAFIRRWDTFRVGFGIADVAAATQLLKCAHDQLTNIILCADPTFADRPVANALRTLKSFPMVPVALGVLRSELSSMKQDPEEPFRAFTARVQGKAETCEFKNQV